MISTTTTAVRGAVAAAAALALVAGAAPALAQVPGGNPGGYVIKVDDTSLVVTVNDKGEAPTTITGSIQNTTDANFRCEVPQFNIGGQNTALGYGQVTTAAAAEEVREYYRTRVFTGPTDTNANGDLVSFGSALDIFPAGSAIGSAEAGPRQAHNEARVAGRTGDPRVNNALQFTVPAGGTVDYTAPLGVPATGDRGEWRAAAVFMCRNMVTNDWFLYIGLEDIEDPNPAPDRSTTGSLGAGSVGS
ncbi:MULTISPECIES: hypothetical protein [unclassified Dietzia]|uniref:hypothetical protein n=1 Tax=unclassified Dietzia TaxID=2617939 RepID=UPI0015FC6BF3|nr:MULTISPECIES: hypothetical protein [unclassified Dietzia]MBB1024565.1 hypothetical protein [Dietzia sp. DQ12-76]MBB1028750.1 hypothetical protein [Dietzia sp. DQ11-38-2]